MTGASFIVTRSFWLHGKPTVVGETVVIADAEMIAEQMNARRIVPTEQTRELLQSRAGVEWLEVTDPDRYHAPSVRTR